jgi:ATP-binding cassette, subfamily B, bacterial
MQSDFVVSGDGHHPEVHGERLQAIPLFRDVAIATLNTLAERFTAKFYQPNQPICEEGAPGDKFFTVVRGTVVVPTRDAGGKSTRLADLQDGDYYGEGEMLSRGRRATTVKARTPTLVPALRAEQFDAMMDELSSLNRIVTQTALGRSLSTICSSGRRQRSHSIREDLSRHAWS